MGIFAQLVRKVTGQPDNPRYKTPGFYPGLRDWHSCAAPWPASQQAVQPPPFAERQIPRLAQRPGETSRPAAYISRDWLQSIRSLTNPDPAFSSTVAAELRRPLHPHEGCPPHKHFAWS